MTPLLAALIGVGLRVDLPEEAPTTGGIELDYRYFLLPDAFVGAAAAWGGGVNDNNPERLLISQTIQAVALLGARLPLDDTFALGATARAGIARLQGWPRGPLTETEQFSPIVGAEGAAAVRLTEHLTLEPRGGVSFVRVKDDWRLMPGVVLALLIDTDIP